MNFTTKGGRQWTARIILASCLWLAVAAARAQEHEQFITFEAGPVFRESLTAQASGAIAGSQRISLGTGFRVNAEFGYYITDWLHGTFNTGLLMNGMTDAVPGNGDPNLYRLPFMAGLVFSYPNTTRLTPFFGVGAGGVFSILDGEFDIAGSRLGSRATDISFAWEVQTGLRWECTDTWDVTLTYRMLGMPGSSFKYDTGTGPATVKLGNSFAHSILLGMSANF